VLVLLIDSENEFYYVSSYSLALERLNELMFTYINIYKSKNSMYYVNISEYPSQSQDETVGLEIRKIIRKHS